MSDYWKNIRNATKTLNEGLKVTLRHMKDARDSRDEHYPDKENYFEKQNGLFTTRYPHEKLPVPDHGRYKLHNEIDDCIVCDKCAKVCPVNCIDIEPVRAVEEIGKTSDGTSKRIFAAKFDIDMAKCCFCGLCTTVCPTECLTMTDEYDFSAYDFAEHNFEFGEMTPLEILQRKKELEEFNKKKEAEKAAKAAESKARPRPVGMPQIKPRVAGAGDSGDKSKPAFRPRVVVKKPVTETDSSTPKPVMKPKVVVKPRVTSANEGTGKGADDEPKTTRPKVVMKPKIPVKKKEEEQEIREEKPKALKPKVSVKPEAPAVKKEQEDKETATDNKPKAVRPKVPMRPKVPARKKDDSQDSSEKGGEA